MLNRTVLKSKYETMMKLLGNATKQPIKLKVPKLTNPSQFDFYNLQAFVSGISSDDLGKSSIFSIDTIEITIPFLELDTANAPKKDLGKINTSIIFDNVTYNIVKEKPSDFGKDFALTLYVNKVS